MNKIMQLPVVRSQLFWRRANNREFLQARLSPHNPHVTLKFAERKEVNAVLQVPVHSVTHFFLFVLF